MVMRPAAPRGRLPRRAHRLRLGRLRRHGPVLHQSGLRLRLGGLRRQHRLRPGVPLSLWGHWGVADTEDCLDAARALAAEGRVDATRMAVRGASAGGLTALNALASGEGFAGRSPGTA